MKLPDIIRIRQRFETSVSVDIPVEIQTQVDRLGLRGAVSPGQTVAIACGSRGVANIAEITRSVVAAVEGLGLEPFIVPAMGSHGGATADGQTRVLEHLGVTPETAGAPIRSSMEVVQIAKTADGIPVYLDRLAHEADYIVPINRIKKHTDFSHELESGVMKLLTIGLGKQKGAEYYHQAVFQFGFPHVIFSVARSILENANVLFGVGTIEDAFARTARVSVMRPDEIEDREKELLAISKPMTAGLPFDDVDILIIDEMGKEISGGGFDTKVVGRIGLPLKTEEPETPRVKRIIICDLTDESEGNAAGVSNADFITRRLYDKMDAHITTVNCLTSCDPEAIKIPLPMDNDRSAVEMAAQCVGLIPPEELRVIRIQNTLRLEEVDVSTAFLEEMNAREDLEAVGSPRPLAFDDQGDLGAF